MSDSLVYWWCVACDQPIDKVNQQEPEIGIFSPNRFAPPRCLTAEPCGHTTDDVDPLVKGGLVTTVGKGVGPVPSINIAGR